MLGGKVYLVGAGPGDVGLITVRGAELLKRADCVVYDRLANPALLKLAGPAAELIDVGKRAGEHRFSQGQINNLLVQKALAGQMIVRLKGGDPCMFGRGAEEAATLANAGIDFEIVPGVTAAVAVAEYAGIMLTDRRYSSQVVFVTGSEAKDKQESNINWSLLANFRGTIVFYMAIANLDLITSELIRNGMLENTPAAVIADATLPTQRVIKAWLGQIGQKCRGEQIEPPAVVVIGTAADSNEQLNWFMNKPLFGCNIIVARDSRGNAELAAEIIRRGGRAIEFVTIQIKPLTESNQFLRTLTGLAEFDWIIFTSPNGVKIFFEALGSLGKDARSFAKAKIACIGGKTANQLARFGIKPDFVPTIFTSAELAKQLAQYANLHSKKILLLRSAIASTELPDKLAEAGVTVEETAVYTTVTAKSDASWLAEKINAGEIDWLMFTSSSTVKGCFEQISTDLVDTTRVKVASIGPVTSAQLRSLGIRVDVEAAEHSTDGLIAAMESHIAQTEHK